MSNSGPRRTTRSRRARADAIAPAQALLAETAARAADVRLFLLDRVGDPWGTVVRAAGASDPAWFNTVYARIPDPVAFLDHVRPELSARLAASSSPPSRASWRCRSTTTA